MMLAANHAIARAAPHPPPEADICLIVEGCYPYIAGGVSSWIDWLLRTQHQHTFSVVSIVSGPEPRQARYERPDNLVDVRDLVLPPVAGARPFRWRPADGRHAELLATTLTSLIRGGGLKELMALEEIVNREGSELSVHDLLETGLTFDIVRLMYRTIMPHSSFLQFYWAWRALFGGLFAVLKCPLPRAGVYHAIATGYAGMLAARAKARTGRPAVITEHGIYTNERRIEILMAEWISDSVDKSLNLDDARMDLRDLWIRVFESYARTCYQACTRITTLYRDNQELQLASGAQPERLEVIANGIDLTRFDGIAAPSQASRPTMALIGRVVPIKDVKTYIATAAIVRREVPNVHALVMGPTDEDPHYFEECSRLVETLGLSECVTFTGSVRITEYMPTIHVVVLTSLSEAQPLVLLEAGAAGIPCVATNVGACREIIEGVTQAARVPVPGGYVTDLVAPDQLADAVCRLLRNHPLRTRLGETLRQRVRTHYASDISRDKYAALYREALAHPPTISDRE